MCLTVKHISDDKKRPLSRLNVKTAYCFHLVLRMHPGDPAHEILPLAQSLRKRTSFCTRNRGKQIHLISSFLLYFSLFFETISSVLWQYLRPTWESVRFASVRSRVRIPPSPPKIRYPLLRVPYFSLCGGIRIMSASHIDGLHRPVQTLVDPLIPFSRPPLGKTECMRIPPSPP